MTHSHHPIVRHLDLFSGIGGFALAAQMAGGIETVAFCEIEEYPQLILAKNFPNVPIHGDVRTLNPNTYGRIDLITGGYPCQPFSVAGRQRGADDDRHLWPEVFRIIKAARPRMVLCENVAGHVNLGLDEVLSDLAAEGYAAQPIIIPACAVDAHHRRDRVWIMGYSQYNGSSTATLGGITTKTGDHDTKRAIQTCQPEGTSGRESNEVVAHTQRIGQQGSWMHGGRINQAADADRKTDWTLHSGERDAAKWDAEPELGRVADGIPDRMDRLRGLGNAIVPQVAAEILRTMMAVNSLLLNTKDHQREASGGSDCS